MARGDEEDFLAFPVMEACHALVQQPETELIPIDPLPYGKISVGACWSPEGPVLTIGLHDRNGVTLVGGLFGKHIEHFAGMFNETVKRVQAGEFDAPERPQ